MPILQNQTGRCNTSSSASRQRLRWFLLFEAIAILIVATMFSQESYATDNRLENGPKPLEVGVEGFKDNLMITDDGKVIRVNADTKYSRFSNGVESKASKADVKEGMKVRIITAKGKDFAHKITILEKARKP